MTNVVNGFLRVPEIMLTSLDVEAPVNYSGTFVLSVRGIVASTTSGAIQNASAQESINVTVLPVADSISTPDVIGVEDFGPIPFGSALANRVTGIVLADRGSGTGNNPETETISQLVIDLPADSALVTYQLSGSFVPSTAGTFSGFGTAQVTFDASTRKYTISSTLLSTAADLGQVSQAVREQAEADIRETLSSISATIGPAHSDQNGSLEVTVTTLDVQGGVASTRDTSFMPIRVQAVADTPSVIVVSPAPSVVKGGANVPLDITVGRSADDDNSETLSVVITLPSDVLGPVGTLIGSPPAGVSMQLVGPGVYYIETTGASASSSPSARESLLNSFLSVSQGGSLSFNPRDDFSGTLLGINGIRVDVISTEDATGIELAPGTPYGGIDLTSKTETVTAYIGVTVLDVPEPSASPSMSASPTISSVPTSVPTRSVSPSKFPSLMPSSSPSSTVSLSSIPDDATFPEDTRFRLQPFSINVPGGIGVNEEVFLGKQMGCVDCTQ